MCILEFEKYEGKKKKGMMMMKGVRVKMALEGRRKCYHVMVLLGI